MDNDWIVVVVFPQDHAFCFDCINSWGTTRENTCPLCKKRFKTITKVDLASGSSNAKGKGRRNRPQKVVRIKDRDQASSLVNHHHPHPFFQSLPIIPGFVLYPNLFGLEYDSGDEFLDDDDDDEIGNPFGAFEAFFGDPLAHAFAQFRAPVPPNFRVGGPQSAAAPLAQTHIAMGAAHDGE